MGITMVIRKRNYSKNIHKDKETNNDLQELEKNKVVPAITIVINVIFALVLPFSLILAMIAPMTFDAPGSDKEFFNWIFFGVTFSFPMVILMSIITSLIFLFVLKLYKQAIIFSLLPMLNVVIFVSCILFHGK